MMRIPNVFSSFLILIIFGLVSCSNSSTDKTSPTTSPATAKNTVKPQSQKNPVAPQPAAPPPVISTPPPVYVYNPEGKRDPFKTYSLAENSRMARPAFPLLNYPLSDLKLVAILAMRKNHLALVQTPDGKGYTIRVGMEVGFNRGKVMEITSQSVTIEEEYREATGEKKKRNIVLSLRRPEEGQI
ncbi:MAG: pilus assembly protein PilP [Nitrospiria bacterium]